MKKVIWLTLLLGGCLAQEPTSGPPPPPAESQYIGKRVTNIERKYGTIIVLTFDDGSTLKIQSHKYSLRIN